MKKIITLITLKKSRQGARHITSSTSMQCLICFFLTSYLIFSYTIIHKLILILINIYPHQESVELPLTHPEYYEEMGIKPPKGVILYGPPGTGKTLLAKAVANQTSATFLRVVGSELIQKYLVCNSFIRLYFDYK